MGSIYVATVDAIALSAATAKTIIELATPATIRATLVQWWVEFDGTVASNTPVKVEVARITASGTGTAYTAKKYSDFAPAALVTVEHTSTAEPTYGDVLEIHRIPPTSGIFIQYPLGREIQIPVSGFLGIRCTAAQTVNVTVGTVWEE
jgi:hypothetical protein